MEDITCDSTENCPTGCKCFLNTYNNNVKTINCSASGLIKFPDINHPSMEAFNYILDLKANSISTLPERNSSIWYKIEKINLANNSLTSLSNLTITDTLKDIRLNDNHLTVFEPQIVNLIKNTTRYVTLSGNPWQCSCELVKMRGIILENNVRDQADITCTAKRSEYKLNQIDQFCPVLPTVKDIVLQFVLPAIGVTIAVLSVLLVKFKLEIKFFLFSKGLCMRWVTEDDIDANKEFDAFVAYSSADGRWVSDIIVPGLEEYQPAYKLCLHDRDWLAGDLIAKLIVTSVDKSRRTIIVLTENFLVSEWSQMEFAVAFQRAKEDKVNRVLVVIPDKVPDLSKASEEFRAFISVTSYLEYKKPHFWRKLRCSMPRLKIQTKN